MREEGIPRACSSFQVGWDLPDMEGRREGMGLDAVLQSGGRFLSSFWP